MLGTLVPRTEHGMLLFSILLIASASRSVLHSQSLDSLVRTAIRAHPTVESTRLAIQRSDAMARAASAWSPPRVGIETRMLPPSVPSPFSRGETMLMIEQAIPLAGQTSRAAHVERMEADVQRASLDVSLRDLRARVERLYYRLWMLDSLRSLVRSNIELAETLYDDVRTTYTVGTTASQADLFTISSEIERLNTEIRTIGSHRAEVQRRLNILLSSEVNDSIVVTDDVESQSLASLNILQDSLSQHPLLAVAEARASKQEARALAEEAQLGPMLSVRGGIGVMPQGHPIRVDNLAAMVGELDANGAVDGSHIGLAFGAMISIPIAPWSKSGPSERADAARLEAKRFRTDLSSTLIDLSEELRTAHGRAERALEWIAYYTNTQLPLLEQSLEVLRTDYMNGRVPFSSLVDAYRMVLSAEEEIVRRRGEYLDAIATIDKLTKPIED